MFLGYKYIHLRLAVGVRIKHSTVNPTAHRQNKDRLTLPIKRNPTLANPVFAKHRAINTRLAKRHVTRRAIQPPEQRLVVTQAGVGNLSNLAGFTIQRGKRTVTANIQPIPAQLEIARHLGGNERAHLAKCPVKN